MADFLVDQTVDNIMFFETFTTVKFATGENVLFLGIFHVNNYAQISKCVCINFVLSMNFGGWSYLTTVTY